MCLAETRVKLDPSEFSAIVQLCITCCQCVKSSSEGLEIKTFGTYPGLPCLWLWNSRFFSIDSTRLTQFPRVPGSLVERPQKSERHLRLLDPQVMKLSSGSPIHLHTALREAFT
jgi:hypothetical protein